MRRVIKPVRKCVYPNCDRIVSSQSVKLLCKKHQTGYFRYKLIKKLTDE